jgi:hypothetical protein
MSPTRRSTGRRTAAGRAKPRAGAKQARSGAAARTARATRAGGSRPRRPSSAGSARAAAPAKRPGLAVVPGAARRPAKPAPPPAFPQSAGASEKQMVLFQLVKARAQLHAAIQGLVAGAAEQPLGERKWNAREIVLHLCCRDRARLREFEAALRGVPVSWQGLDDEEMARVNAQDLQAVSHLAWDEAQRLLHTTRQSLMEAVEGVPEDPPEPWSEAHPFGWMLHALPRHDRHHAEIIKKWRAETGT